MNEQTKQSDISKDPASLHLFWIVITALFAVFFVINLFEWSQETERIDRMLTPAAIFLIGLINIFSISGALRNILTVVCIFLVIAALIVMLYR